MLSSPYYAKNYAGIIDSGLGPRTHHTMSTSRSINGDEQFNEWVSHFESIAAVNGWRDEDKLLWLRVRLTGRAHVAYNRLAHETQGDYSLTKVALHERFEPPSKRPLYKVEFESRRKQSKESWADFGDELLVFASKAFPLLQDEPQKELAFSKYLDQLSNPQVYFRVKQCHPKTINEALAVLLN